MNLKIPVLIALAAIICQSCQKETSASGYVVPGTTKVNFTFRFDSTQVRLNNLGQPAVMPAGNAAQSPRFNSMSAHYVELTKDQFTGLGAGAVLYTAPEVTTGGSKAIDFSNAKMVGNNEVFLSVPLGNLPAGTYNWLRVSLAYQNYTVTVEQSGFILDATIASFIGFNTYVQSFKIKDSTVIVNANKAQGYWAVEAGTLGFGIVQTGQAPPGATTVPNPIFATSPVPQGSCVVTGQFSSPLVITGAETNDINIRVNLSTNKSFEWKDGDSNGKFNPGNGDQVVDMGIRGMIPVKL
ncbi:MAG: hypothetical protein ABIQ31_24650 [Ferruginibacter sp.]